MEWIFSELGSSRPSLWSKMAWCWLGRTTQRLRIVTRARVGSARSTGMIFDSSSKTAEIDLDPARLFLFGEQLTLAAGRRIGGAVHADAPGGVHLAEVSDHALARPAGAAIALNQRPIGVTLAIFFAITAS